MFATCLPLLALHAALPQDESPPEPTRLVELVPRDSFEVERDGVRVVAWHPRGKLVAAAYRSGELRLWELGGDEPVLVLEAGSEGVPRDLVFVDDGDVLLLAGAGAGVLRWDLEDAL